MINMVGDVAQNYSMHEKVSLVKPMEPALSSLGSIRAQKNRVVYSARSIAFTGRRAQENRVVYSARSIAFTGKDSFGFFSVPSLPERKPPVIVKNGKVDIDTKRLEVGKFYQVENEEETYLIRMPEKGVIEMYEVVE